MNINQLRYFIAAAQSGSFTKTADRFFITQTAVTQQIRALEEELSATLFDRGTRPVKLTPAGRLFLNDAKAIVERLDRAVERMGEASTGIVGNLRIGYTKGYERSDLSRLLQRYHRKRPNVLMSCFRGSTDELAALLLARELDLIFTWDSTNLRADERVSAKEVEQVGLVVAMYPAHPLSHRTALRREELAGERIFYMSPSAEPDNHGDAAFLQRYREAGYTPDILFRSTDAESVLMMVASEEGISILPDYFTRKLDNADNLVFVPLEGDREVELIHAMCLKDSRNPALDLLWDMIE